MDYLIGPLPISHQTSIRPLSEHYHNPVPLNARSTFNWTVIAQFASKLLEPLNEATLDLFNGSVSENTLIAAGQGPMSYDGSWRRSWLQLRRNVPGSWLHGLDFYLYVSNPRVNRIQRRIAYINRLTSREQTGRNIAFSRSSTTESCIILFKHSWTYGRTEL